MKKSERLNQELIYLSYRSQFHLKELQNEFHISERTALRDISELESMGLSFYVEKGRYGAYHLIQQRLWTPIRFNLEEINAIFFAIKALKRMSATPFSNAYQQIYHKLMDNLPKNRRDQVIKKQSYVFYREQPSLHNIKYFQLLIKAAEDNLVLKIENHQYFLQKQNVQVKEIFYQTGNWFCQVYALNLDEWFILRCDKILNCEIASAKGKSRSILNKKFESYQKTYYKYPFKCKLTKFGKEKVLLNMYPKMKIAEKDDAIYLEGRFAKPDFDYLVDYLIGLGSDIKIVSPRELKQAYLNKIEKIVDQYTKKA